MHQFCHMQNSFFHGLHGQLAIPCHTPVHEWRHRLTRGHDDDEVALQGFDERFDLIFPRRRGFEKRLF
jgi:hypothetical protein